MATAGVHIKSLVHPVHIGHNGPLPEFWRPCRDNGYSHDVSINVSEPRYETTENTADLLLSQITLDCDQIFYYHIQHIIRQSCFLIISLP
jgi:hypothetical protein